MTFSPKPSEKAFTLVEALAVAATLFLLSLIFVPAFAKARQSPLATQCLNNHRQLMLAALMYADDSAGLWFPNQPSGFAGERDWVTDNMNFAPGNRNNFDISVLTNPSSDFFAKYIKSPCIFHCPADQSRTPEGPRIRSVSASQSVGTIWNGAELQCPQRPGDPVTGQWLSGASNDCSSTWRRYGKASDMVAPGSSQLWVFTDKPPSSSTNDTSFAVQVANTGLGGAFVDVPGSYHEGAVGISFADGHVELHKWVGTSIPSWPINVFFPPNFGTPFAASAEDVADLQWLQVRTSALANP